MFEAINAFVYLEADPSKVVEACGVIFIHKFLRGVRELDPDIFWVVERHPEVEVFDVKAGEACIWCGDDAVDEELG